MSIKVDTSGAEAFLINTARRTTRAARRQIEVEAKRVMELSQRYSPRDTGELEGSHFIEKEEGDGQRKVMVVGFDADHGMVVHENLDGKNYGFGERSVEKANALGLRPGLDVGPKFLERALRDTEEVRIRNMEEAVKKA